MAPKKFTASKVKSDVVQIDQKANERFEVTRRCSNCILPENFPGIRFDNNGVCNYCSSYKPINVLGEKTLKDYLSRYENAGNHYDCIVPVSGGRDSIFVLHQIATGYKLKILAVMVDTDDHTPEAIKNIQNAADILNIDYVILKDERAIERSRQNLKNNFNAWLEKPSLSLIVPIMTLRGKTINKQLINYAKLHNIPLIIGGTIIGNSTFEKQHYKTGYLGIFPNEQDEYTTPQKLKLAMLFAYEYISNPKYITLRGLEEGINGFYSYFFADVFKPKEIDMIGFFDYICWNESEILSTIIKELKWVGLPNTTATWRIHDKSGSLINYIYYNIVGFTEHDEMYSKMIREGQISRRDALERCKVDHQPRMDVILTILDDIGVSLQHLDSVLKKYREDFLKINKKDLYKTMK